ncbi:hypothetical protein FIU97_03585 [Roseivivax sp. THAF40]|uniref:hypothetical protein n=1 Tax=unclassified Roseivivax TaxID=2639302 RepID=UPI001267CD78|nr:MULTISPECIES: hypothetical protein [unclassified Roseivivax]QFS81850.1 hypothetical protein FIV09_03325 [Roseivivax sp. THAF197b]QFT45650.1 hypothetical protein FIU97_03585 [Roseivivax sp. THAF40]
MMYLTSGLIVIAAYAAMIAIFGYLILTKDPAPDGEAEPYPLDAAPGFGLKLTGCVALATLVATSLVMWLDM